jgi:hypothetical protein
LVGVLGWGASLGCAPTLHTIHLPDQVYNLFGMTLKAGPCPAISS